MKTYQEMTLAERQAEYARLCRTHQEQKALGLELNMARGKPGREQLDMVMEMYNIPLTADDFITDGIDARNYGYVAGIPIARKLFADLLGAKPRPGHRRRKLLPGVDVRRRVQGVYPRPAAQREALGQAGPGEVAVSGAGIRPAF